MFHDMDAHNPTHVFRHLPILIYVDAFIYQVYAPLPVLKILRKQWARLEVSLSRTHGSEYGLYRSSAADVCL